MLPDNALFKGSTGEAICRRLLYESDAHAQMLLPTSALYVQDVKEEVLLLFDHQPTNETPWTRELWIYDLHTDQGLTLKTNPRTLAHLDDFVPCYRAGKQAQWVEPERFTYEELPKRYKANLNIF